MTRLTRLPAVAGQFYPDTVNEIKDKIEKFISRVVTKDLDGRAKAIIVPHAGYDYSGMVSASAYKQLKGKKYDTVILIGNSHTAYFDGAAIDNSDFWQTPLGKIEIDKVMANKLVNSNYSIKFNSSVHLNDHVLEVQVPFLQTVLGGNFKIVPILFGNQRTNSYLAVAQALSDNLGDNDLIVASSDMSHYPSYENAYKIDKKTLEIIKSGDVNRLEMYIKEVESNNVPDEQTLLCGMDAVKTVMSVFQKKIWDSISILEYANSGDTSGDKSKVVGYGAVAFLENQQTMNLVNGKEEVPVQAFINIEQQKILLNIAKETVEAYVKTGKILDFGVTDEMLKKPSGAFVTLHKNSQLRGCIGQILPTEQPLWHVVRDMALEAATSDPRFEPITVSELPEIKYEISVLSQPEKISDWQQIEMGKHGVIIKQDGRTGVFLPQVATETGWSREEFLSQLCSQKAGLDAKCYLDPNTEIKTFSAQVFGEK